MPSIKTYAYHGCCGLTFLIGIFFIVFKLFFLEGLIQSMAASGVIMNNDTYTLWGIIPGDTQTYTVRNFSIFNFNNPHEFLYRAGDPTIKPNFTQYSGFLYQEKNIFDNIQYIEEGTKVAYDYWLYFDLLNNSKDVNKPYTVVNVAPLGFWMQLSTTQDPTFAVQGFGGLFVEMNNTIKAQALGQGVSSTFFPKYEIFLLTCNNQEINQEVCWYLWNDPNYGLDNENNYAVWVNAAFYNDRQSIQFLYQYFFPLPRIQFDGLIKEIGDLCKVVNKIISNWYCGSQECPNYNMTIKQIASASVTNNPPSGEKQESICSLNKTCIGWPEIPNFLHHQFSKKYKEQKYQKLEFSQQLVAYLFTPYKRFLNVGYLQSLYSIGQKFDQNPSTNLLGQIKSLLMAESNDHALVIWQWVKYMTNQFVLKEGKEGTKKIAGLGAVSSQALYQVTTQFAQIVLEDLYAFMAREKIRDKCADVLNFLPSDKSRTICKEIKFYSYKSYYTLISPCLNYYKHMQFQNAYELTDEQMGDFCDMDEEPSGIGKVTLDILAEVADWYHCTESHYKKCTNLDIIIKQMISSQITKNPINNYRFSTLTANEWFRQIPTFQYSYYLYLSNVSDPQVHTEADIRDLYTFDKLLNGPAVQQLFLLHDQQKFKKQYHWDTPSLLRNYIRFILIEVGFGGLTQQRSAKQLLFGYNDPFLQTLKATDPMLGGDPSIQTLISFNQLNLTEQEAKLFPQVMYTGSNNSSLVRQFDSIFEKTYITVNQTSFDGEQVLWQMKSPWAEDVTIHGTDGFQTPPNLATSDEPYIYISSIARFSQVIFNKTVQKEGMSLYDMRIKKDTLQSKYDNPENQKYYQSFTSLLNSSYQGFPLMVSKTHFLDADQVWAQRIVLADENGFSLTANQYDNTRLLVQPYTGTSFSAIVALQVNYFYDPDILFPQYQLITQDRDKSMQQISQNKQQIISDQMKLLPVMNTFRSGNISSHAVDVYFGDLRWIVNARRGFAICGFLIIGFSIFVILAVKVREEVILGKAKQKKDKKIVGNKPSLLESSAYDQEQD